MSVEEVTATIRRGVQALGEAQSALAAISDQIGSARSQAAAAIRGSDHETVRRGLAKLDEADEVADRTLAHLRDGVSGAEAYLDVIE